MTIKLDGTNGITNVNGTAAAPAETGTTSTNTGISFGTNTVTVSTAGSARATFDASGNLGIGTTSPGYKLDVQSSTASLNLYSTTTTNISYINFRNVGYNYVGVENSAGGGLFTGSSAYALALGTISAYPIQFGTSGAIRATIDSSGNVGIGTSSPTQKLDVTGSANVSGTVAMGSSFLRNRIINGDMRIDQRNAGAAVTVNTALDFFPVDRFACSGQATDGVFTAQQSSTAPAGFTKSVVCTVTTADASIGATQRYFIEQKIEGYNVADFGFGAAGAATVTLSFWVRSSLTGTFGGAVYGGQFYPFSYTINAANTWEQKTVTIAGSTSGTWNTTTSAGLYINFSLGTGSTYKGTANAWTNSTTLSVTGAVDLINTNGATFYITGVQLEVGSVATPFERRLYGQELALCQRYYYRISSSGNYTSFGVGVSYATTIALVNMPLPVTMRAVPTAADFSAAGNFVVFDGGTNSAATAISLSYGSTNSISMTVTTVATMTAARPTLLEANGGSAAYIGVTAEL